MVILSGESNSGRSRSGIIFAILMRATSLYCVSPSLNNGSTDWLTNWLTDNWLTLDKSAEGLTLFLPTFFDSLSRISYFFLKIYCSEFDCACCLNSTILTRKDGFVSPWICEYFSRIYSLSTVRTPDNSNLIVILMHDFVQRFELPGVRCV